MSASDFANVYASINNLQNQFDAITGNTLSNYNQLSRIVAQQGNIYNSVYYGAGDVSTRNLSVSANALISGNLVISNGNVGIWTSNPLANLDIQGNARITGNVNIDNGLIWTDPINNRVGINTITPQNTLQVIGDGNISGSMYSSTGYIPLCRASISFRYVSTTLTTLYSNNCSIARNGTGSYTITLTNPPNSTNYTIACWATITAGTTITQAFTSNALIATVGLKTNTQTLIWISDNNSEGAFDPVMCDVHVFW